MREGVGGRGGGGAHENNVLASHPALGARDSNKFDCCT